jgi:hypothetical protein
MSDFLSIFYGNPVVSEVRSFDFFFQVIVNHAVYHQY